MNFIEYNEQVHVYIEETTEFITNMEYMKASDKQLEIVKLAANVEVTCKDELDAILDMVDKASSIARKLANLHFDAELAMLEMQGQPIQ